MALQTTRRHGKGSSWGGRDPAERRSVLEEALVGFFQTSVDGRLLWVNSEAARIVGFEDPRQFLSEVPDIRAIYAEPERREAFIGAIEERGSVRDFRYRIRRRDGTLRWISVTARALRAPSGELEGFEGSVVDVTESMLVESAARRITSEPEPSRALELFAETLRQIVPFTHLSVIVLEGEDYRQVVTVGQQLEWLAEGDAAGSGDDPIAEVARTRRPVVVQDTEGGRFTRDGRLARLDIGSYGVVPLVRGEEMFASIAVAFREKGALTSAIMDLLVSVAATVAPGVSNLLLLEERQESIRRLEEINRLRNDFVAMLAHDLRSPLAVIVGMTEMLAQRGDKLSEAHRQEMAASVLKSGRKIDRLVADTMDLTALEAGQLRCRLEPFDLVEVVTSTVEETAAGSGRDRVEVRLPETVPQVVGDRHRTWQVLSNLLSNAVKFSRDDAPILVEVQAGAQGFVGVAVTDGGRGIAPEDQARIFEKFSRPASPSGDEIGGLGLGLYISKSLIEAQGGEISVESTPGRGSTFEFTLPMAQHPPDGRGTDGT